MDLECVSAEFGPDDGSRITLRHQPSSGPVYEVKISPDLLDDLWWNVIGKLREWERDRNTRFSFGDAAAFRSKMKDVVSGGGQDEEGEECR